MPTPMGEGVPDLSYIESAAAHPGAARDARRDGDPGVDDLSRARPRSSSPRSWRPAPGLRAGADFHLGYSPERIDPGNADLAPGEHAQGRLRRRRRLARRGAGLLRRHRRDHRCRCRGTREAELTKLLENTFRHVNIALVNELAMFARDLGIDVWEAIDAASTKPFGYMRFTPGPGVGGHCLPIDPSYLSWQVERSLGQTFRFVELANDVNEHMPDYVVRRVQALLNDQRKAVQGLDRCSCTDWPTRPTPRDARETPSRPIVDQLLRLGRRGARWSTRTWPAAQFPDEATAVSTAPPMTWPTPTWCSTWSTTTTSTATAIAASGVPVLDCRRALSGDSDVQHL
ncbi:MAG: hypothetical protein V9E94_20470 [Microthrixaceae bacterium]